MDQPREGGEAHGPFARVGLLGLVLWMAGSGAALYGITALLARPHARSSARETIAALAIWGYGALVAWMVFEFRRHRIDLARLLGPAPRAGELFKAFGLVLLQGWFALQSISAALYLMSLWAPDFVVSRIERNERVLAGLEDLPRPVAFLLLVVIAPAVEELFFRGVLFHRLAAGWGVRRAALVSGLVFGLLHPNPPAMFLFALLLTVLYLRTGSLWLTMACHSFNNAVPAALLLLVPRVRDVGGAALEMERLRDFGWVTVVMALLLGWVLVAYVARHWPAADAPPPYLAAAPAVQQPLAPADDVT